MRQKMIKNKYFDFKMSDTKDILENFKSYINKYDCPEIVLDVSSLNVIDAARVMILSSTYHFQKYPGGKLKCKVPAKEVKEIISSFAPANLELV